jgi:hypothetical protein
MSVGQMMRHHRPSRYLRGSTPGSTNRLAVIEGGTDFRLDKARNLVQWTLVDEDQTLGNGLRLCGKPC